MKYVFALLFASTLVAHARDGGGTSADPIVHDSTVFSCAPTDSQPNGLGIESLVLELSNEDPDAIMTLEYQRSNNATHSDMAYEGDDRSGYNFTPYSKKDGEVSVRLKKNGRSWIASVKSEYVDTYSLLTCKKN